VARICGRAVDDDDLVEALLQKADASVDFTQLALAVDLFGVLGTVAERGGVGHRLRDLRALHAPK
jgi:hypothetical protein